MHIDHRSCVSIHPMVCRAFDIFLQPGPSGHSQRHRHGHNWDRHHRRPSARVVINCTIAVMRACTHNVLTQALLGDRVRSVASILCASDLGGGPGHMHTRYISHSHTRSHPESVSIHTNSPTPTHPLSLSHSLTHSHTHRVWVEDVKVNVDPSSFASPIARA